MRKLKAVSGGLMVCMLLTAASFAATNKGSFDVFSKFTVNGKQLKAGHYALRWDGQGPAVQLDIVQDGKVVATTAAKMVTMENPPNGSSTVLTTQPDGSQSLAQIRFGGKKYALEIAEPSANENGMGSNQ